MTESRYQATILYDNECVMCSRFKHALEGLDSENKLYFHPISDVSIYNEYPELNPTECEDTVHLIDNEGKVYKGSEVITYLAHYYPGVNKFAWLLDSETGKKAVDMFYNALNNIRKSSLNPCTNCRK